MREYYYILTYSSLLFIIPCLYHYFFTKNIVVSYLSGMLSFISFLNWKNILYPKLIHFIDRCYVRILFIATLCIFYMLSIYQLGLLLNLAFFYGLSKYCHYKKYNYRSVFHAIFHLHALALAFTFTDTLAIKAFSQWS